jgi:hypothetical protein
MTNNNLIFIAKLNDASEIMQFIDDEWKKGHIFATNKDFFLYEYQNKNNLNFVISKSKSNKINGILGFLKSSSEENSTVWTTMWKVSKSSGSPMLGVDMLNFLRTQGFKSVMSLGINEQTKDIYKYLHFHVGVMNHYFIPNLRVKEKKISIMPKDIGEYKHSYIKSQELSFKRVGLKDLEDNFDFNKCTFQLPFKDLNYFQRRYFQHPIYDYDLYGSYRNNKLEAVIVVRIFKYLDSTCMRIVDFYGQENFLEFITSNLIELMYEANHEYIDFYCEGLSKKMILKAGFLEVDFKNKELVIPNHFEPFVQKNIAISYFTDSQCIENLRIFKADGDQDRPSSPNKDVFSK